MEYLLTEIVLFLLTALVHWKAKIKLFSNKKQSLAFWLAGFALGIIWDTFAIYRGHWSYAEQYLIGLTIGIMPFEDYVFIGIVLYAILVTYRLSKRFKN